jgi:hypothetical protein
MATASTVLNKPHQPVTSARNAARDISARFGRTCAARQAGSRKQSDVSRVHIGRLLAPALCCTDHVATLATVPMRRLTGRDRRFYFLGQPSRKRGMSGQ